MPLRIGRVRTALPAVLDHTSNPASATAVTEHSSIWITDELLQRTVERFWRTKLHSRQCIRHGSTAPGPLEARRRLAKRRMNNLAISGGDSSFSLDPVILAQTWFGRLWNGQTAPDELEWTWQPPKTFEEKENETKTADPDIYAKVNHFLDSLIVPEKKLAALKKEQEQELIGQPQQELAPISHTAFQEQLHSVRSLIDLKTMYDRIASAPLDAPNCSIAALNHLVQLGVPTSDVFKFLDDSRLNAAYAANLAMVFHHCIFDRDQFSRAAMLFEQGLSLHTINSQSLLEILEFLPVAASRLFQSSYDPVLLGVLDRICGSISISNISTSHELLESHMRRFFKPAASDVKVFTHAKILASVVSGCKDKFPNHSESLSVSFGAMLRCHWENKQVVAEEAPESANATFSVQKLSDTLPIDLARFILIHTAYDLAQKFRIARKSDRKEAVLKQINVLLEEIRHLELDWVNDPVWTSIYDQLAATIEPAKIYSHFKKLHHADQCRVLLRHWAQLNAQDSTVDQTESLKDFLKNLEQDFDLLRHEVNWPARKRRTKASNSYLSLLKVLKESNQLYIPTYEHLLELMLAIDKPLAFHDIVLFAKSDLGIMASVDQRHVVANYVHMEGSRRPALAYRVFCAVDSLALSHCPTLVLDCIASVGWQLHPRSICKLFERPDPYAIRELGLSRRTPVSPDLDSSERNFAPFRRTQEDCFPNKSCYSFRRLDLMHKAALAFATSERMSKGAAWEATFECWRLLQYAGKTSNLDSRITKALIHAGIVRRLQGNVKRSGAKLEGDTVKEDVVLRHVPRGVFEAVRRAVERIDGSMRAEQLVIETNALANRAKLQFEKDNQQSKTACAIHI